MKKTLLFLATTGFALALGAGEMRVTDCGGDVWRLQSADDAGAFSDRGAVQVFKEFLGERHEDRSAKPSAGRAERRAGGGWRILAPDGRVLVETGAPTRDAEGRPVLTLFLAEGEGVYGGGSRFDTLDKRGTAFNLSADDGWNRSDTMYLPIPFFTTTRGAGIYLNTFASMRADVGKSAPGVWTIAVDCDRSLDVYVFAAGSLAKSLEAFRNFVGVAPAPRIRPGPLVCRLHTANDYNTFPKIRRIYDEHVKAGIRPGAMIIEPWPITRAYTNAAKRAELDEMGAFFRKEDVPLLIWTPCGAMIYTNAPGFKSEYAVRCDVYTNGVLKEAGSMRPPAFFANGKTNPDIAGWYRHPPMLDVTNPEAREWFEKSVLKFLADRFVLGAKIDFCELLGDEGRAYGKERTSVRYHWKNPSVFGGQSIHHAYPAFFSVSFYNSLKRATGGRDDVFVFCRGGGGLGNFRTPWYWAGDQMRRFEKQRDVLRVMLNSRLSGIPYMSYDMAGYTAAPPDRVEEGRIFARAAEFTKFMPIVQTHGNNSNFFDLAPEVRAIYRDALAFHAKNKGTVRPLVERWPDDPKTHAIDDEFLFGDDLLVAPILDNGSTRTVYLPAGEWREELTGRTVSVPAGGRTLTVTAALAETPTFRLQSAK